MTRISVQLYSLRNAGPLARQLDLVRDSGLGAVELTSSNFNDPGETRRLLDERGLVSPSGHVGVERLRGDLDATARTARGLGLELLVLWGLPDAERWTDREGWERAGRELGDFARRLADQGMRFAFHNHDWELGVLPDGAVALDALFAACAETPLEWQADLAWLERGGSDAGAWTAKPGPVLRTVHVKDLARPGEAPDEDGWADPGAGRLDWAAWWHALERRGVELFVLEHDEPSDPALARRSGRLEMSAAPRRSHTLSIHDSPLIVAPPLIRLPAPLRPSVSHRLTDPAFGRTELRPRERGEERSVHEGAFSPRSTGRDARQGSEGRRGGQSLCRAYQSPWRKIENATTANAVPISASRSGRLAGAANAKASAT